MVNGLPSYSGSCAAAVVRCGAGINVISVNNTILSTNMLGEANYPVDAQCSWLIQGTVFGGYVPVITIFRFATEPNFDFFTVYDGSSFTSNELFLASGTNVPVPITVTSNSSSLSLFVTFTSDYSAQLTGVLAMVTFVPSSGACPANSAGVSVVAGCTCNAGFRGSIVAVANYYNGSCVYAGCPSLSIGTVSGCACTSGPESIITITMVKGLPAYAGTCAVAVSRCPAGSTVISVNDTLISTNPLGATDYAARSRCAWLIQSTTPGFAPVLTVTSFATQFNYDYFSVFDGGSNASVLLLGRSGN